MCGLKIAGKFVYRARGEDFPQAGPLESSAYSSARRAGGRLEITMKPVAFTRVRPGESLLNARARSAA